MSKGNITTVNGKISPDNLGVTLPHEHLVLGGNNTAQLYRKRYPPPTDPKIRSMLDEPVKLENLWLIRKEGFTYLDNLIIEDVDMISNDLLDYKKYGGTSVVDITPPSLGSDPTKVKQISDKTGLNIIYGLGFYIEAFHPEYVSKKTVKELTQEFLDIIKNGYNNTGIKPGIIGEIGTSSPKTTPQEEKVLEAVANTHIETGYPINIHLSNILGRCGVEVANFLKNKGVSMDKLVLSHMDMQLDDRKYHDAVLETGTWFEYDTWGNEGYINTPEYVFPRDSQRLDNLVRLIDKGYIDRLLISTDACRKTAYKKYGGEGFDYILRNIVPKMEKAGITKKEINTIMVTNTRKMLSVI